MLSADQPKNLPGWSIASFSEYEHDVNFDRKNCSMSFVFVARHGRPVLIDVCFFLLLSLLLLVPLTEGDAMTGADGVEVAPLPAMDPYLTPGFVLLLAGVGFLSLLVLALVLLLCQRAFKYKQGYQPPSAQVR